MSNVVTPEKHPITGAFSRIEKVEDEFVKRLHFAVWPMSDFEVLKDLLHQRPQEIHGCYGPNQETLLHRACRYGKQKMFDFLLLNGAVSTARNKTGQTPLHLACRFARIDMIQQLTDSDCRLDQTDDNGDQAIHYAAQSGCIKAIELLIGKGVMKCVSGWNGNTILHYAAKYGQMELLKLLLSKGCNPNMMNELTETPLHLAASHYTYEHGEGVDVIELLLSYGANLSASTHWGDTAAHYAGLHGTSTVLTHLINLGCTVDKPSDIDPEDFFDKHGVPPDDRADYKLSLLQKVAKSGCQIKAHVVLEEIMKARNKMAKNMYYGNRGAETFVQEMNDQEMAFLKMSQDFNVSSCSSGEGALFMFLKYSPDSLVKLFDLCVVKPCKEQLQGTIYFDFFLFNPHTCDPSSSELSIIDALITSGKERFLIHPIFETFLKLKWYKTWTFYLLYIIVDFVFLLSLAGYTLIHFGKIYEGFENWDYDRKGFWWYFLAFCHFYTSIITLGKILQMLGYLMKVLTAKRRIMSKMTIVENVLEISFHVIKSLVVPVIISLVLYGNFDTEFVRYFLAVTVILTSYQFMTIISRLPKIGLYVHMLTRVMMTVLNFFASYFWHFLGYAIAFHILLSTSEPFKTLFDSIVKVLAMLMGEYEYTINFVSNEDASVMAKILFVVFVIDMSVVLMNLVLGLAISDIEELQRNSAVRRMMQEGCTVMFIENIYRVLSLVPGMGRFFSARITNDRTCTFQDVVYLDLVDLDKSPKNRLVIEQSFPFNKCKTYVCPHSIVTNVTKVIKDRLIATRTQDPMVKLEQEIKRNQDTQHEILKKLETMEKKMRENH